MNRMNDPEANNEMQQNFSFHKLFGSPLGKIPVLFNQDTNTAYIYENGDRTLMEEKNFNDKTIEATEKETVELFTTEVIQAFEDYHRNPNIRMKKLLGISQNQTEILSNENIIKNLGNIHYDTLAEFLSTLGNKIADPDTKNKLSIAAQNIREARELCKNQTNKSDISSLHFQAEKALDFPSSIEAKAENLSTQDLSKIETFMQMLGEKLQSDGEKDKENGRTKLAQKLKSAADAIIAKPLLANVESFVENRYTFGEKGDNVIPTISKGWNNWEFLDGKWDILLSNNGISPFFSEEESKNLSRQDQKIRIQKQFPNVNEDILQKFIDRQKESKEKLDNTTKSVIATIKNGVKEAEKKLLETPKITQETKQEITNILEQKAPTTATISKEIEKKDFSMSFPFNTPEEKENGKKIIKHLLQHPKDSNKKGIQFVRNGIISESENETTIIVKIYGNNEDNVIDMKKLTEYFHDALKKGNLSLI